MKETIWITRFLCLLLFMATELHGIKGSCNKAGCTRCDELLCMETYSDPDERCLNISSKLKSCDDGQSDFSCNAGCANIKTGRPGVLASPNYPFPFDSHLNIKYVISAPPNYRIILTFTDFVMAPDHSGTHFTDFVEVYDGKYPGGIYLGKYAGTVPPGEHKSKTRHLTILFYSVSYKKYRGFRATYVFEPYTFEDECRYFGCVRCDKITCMPHLYNDPDFRCNSKYGKELQSCEEGNKDPDCYSGCKVLKELGHSLLTSPNYPRKYGGYMSTKYYIKAPRDFAIFLKFTYFNIRSDPWGHYFDEQIEIYDGKAEQGVLAATYAGDSLPKMFISKTSDVTVWFITKTSKGANGFVAEYWFEPKTLASTAEEENDLSVLLVILPLVLIVGGSAAALVVELQCQKKLQNQQNESGQQKQHGSDEQRQNR